MRRVKSERDNDYKYRHTGTRGRLAVVKADISRASGSKRPIPLCRFLFTHVKAKLQSVAVRGRRAWLRLLPIHRARCHLCTLSREPFDNSFFCLLPDTVTLRARLTAPGSGLIERDASVPPTSRQLARTGSRCTRTEIRVNAICPFF